MIENNLPWWRADRPWGFRFSIFDAVVTAVGVAGTVIGVVYYPPLAILIPFILGHFLLFCNTFRVGGERSLIWIGALLVNVCWWGWAHPTDLPWASVVLTQFPVTTILIGQTVLGRNYHGIACEWINPQRYRTGALSEGAFTTNMLRRFGAPARAIEVLTGRKQVAEADTAETTAGRPGDSGEAPTPQS
jgi:hypothetical protein